MRICTFLFPERCVVKSMTCIEALMCCSLFKDDMPATLTSRPHTALSFLAPEPEDLEDLYSRYKVWRLHLHLSKVTKLLRETQSATVFETMHRSPKLPDTRGTTNSGRSAVERDIHKISAVWRAAFFKAWVALERRLVETPPIIPSLGNKLWK